MSRYIIISFNKYFKWIQCCLWLYVWFMVFNATFNHISAISWRAWLYGLMYKFKKRNL